MAKSKCDFKAEDMPLPSSDEDEAEDPKLVPDEDICSAFELKQHYQITYQLADESAVSLRKDYVLSLCSDSGFTRIAAGLSDASVQLFDIKSPGGLQHAQVENIPAPLGDAAANVSICGVRFLDGTPNCLLLGTTDGVVRLFDLRIGGRMEQTRFANTATDVGAVKTISCFDRNANSRILCTGTEQHQNNVSLLFYDIRERKQLGGYFDSHQDDITAVRFHAKNPDLLCSGATDGLINIYDIKETEEEDALQLTINTESSVHKLNWHTNVYEQDLISCITHTHDFKSYDCEEGDLLAEFERAEITKAARRKNPANCNVIDAHNLPDGGGIFLLAGTYFQKSDVLRSLRVSNKKLQPFADFVGNKQIVRESLYDAQSHAIVTAGESGIVSLWTPQTGAVTQNGHSDANKLKSKTKLKTTKKTPY